ncbi:hypothetical protein lbkm_3871 [Lachnospiraceae bacterium KM106-2]|nr:hypothetical protein lbkm_3871 [Lachnospiraceae bacterium KM106-2]
MGSYRELTKSQGAREHKVTTAKQREKLTMEKLVAFMNAGKLDHMTYQEFCAYANGVKVDYSNTDDGSLTAWIHFSLKYKKDTYRLEVSYYKPKTAEGYGHKEYEIDDIRLCNKATYEEVILYSSQPEKCKVTKNIKDFLNYKEDIKTYVKYILPQKLEQSRFTYRDWEGGGCRFYLKNKKKSESKWQQWACDGGVGLLQEEDLMISLKNQKISVNGLEDNHCESISKLEQLSDCQIPAAIQKWKFDLYTIPEIEKAKEAGKEIPIKDQTARVWIVFLKKDNKSRGFVFYLNANYFTKQQMITFARTAKFTKQAIMQQNN